MLNAINKHTYLFKYPALAMLCTVFSGYTHAAPGYKNGSSLPAFASQTILLQNKGVIPNDGLDDAPAIQAAIDDIAINNSPNNRIILKLPRGVIDLHDEIHVDRSGIIIEGAGSDPSSGTSIVIKSWSPYDAAGDGAPDFDKKYWPGFGAFRVESRVSHSRGSSYEGSINYHWYSGAEFERPAALGDTVLHLKRGKAALFSIGSLIYVGAANDVPFLDLGEVPESKRQLSHITTGHMRTQIFKVAGVNTNNDTVTLDKPLEFDIPINNGRSNGYKSRVMPVTAIQDVGFHNFHITMDSQGTNCEGLTPSEYDSRNNPNGVKHRYQNMCPQDAIHGLIFKWAYNSWVQNVNLEMLGSHPIVTEFAKNMTFLNNTINGSWNKGAGGNGYFRGSKLYDSLIKGNSIKNIRHLTLQWSATGNVVEDNTLNADLNLHGGWERNNIIRNNTIEVPFLHRSWSNGQPGNGTWQPIWYGSGFQASKWSGPTGPHNTFINNTLKKQQAPGGAMARWGLFDTPDVRYIFAWDGQAFKHLNDFGNIDYSWKGAIAQAVYEQMPESGVLRDGDAPADTDTDKDGVANSIDQCLNTPRNTAVDVNGCAIFVNTDDDNDGVVNTIDQCPNTQSNADVDLDGCAIVTDNGNNDAGNNNASCSTIIDIPWKTSTEVVLDSTDSCIRMSRDLSQKTLQLWDSDTAGSCDFRGTVTAIDGSGSITVDKNYKSSKSFSGTLLKLSPSNGCPLLKVRTY